MKSYNNVFKYTVYSIGAGLASFISVLLLNLTGQYLGFKLDENVPIEEIGYINVLLFLVAIGIEAAASYGVVFSIINKIFKFK